MVTERASSVDLAGLARAWRVEVTDRLLPYWFDTAQDLDRGGYLLADDAAWRNQLRYRLLRPRAKVKQLVTQARVIWTFSHVHRLGLSTPSRDFLGAAAHGYRFLVEHFDDPICGGYVMSTEVGGNPLDTTKLVYGQGFAIYAFVEYARATGSDEPLERALALLQLTNERAHDDVHGGWFEPSDRGWQHTDEEDIGLRKIADAHLHWMEALAELVDATHDPAATRSLEEVLDINQTRFFAADPRAARAELMHDWAPAPEPEAKHISYGHNAEFGWLMLRAEQVSGRAPSWERFNALIDHVLDHGVDPAIGGVFTTGTAEGQVIDTRKLWWSQAEMVAALTDAILHRRNERYERALADLLGYVRSCQADPVDGIWFESVDAAGKPLSAIKAGIWKANYHDVRALVKFSDAFAPR